jgi:phospholipid N-methyltransferase
MSALTFLREFIRDPVQLGAVAPSGPQLAQLMVEAADIGPDDHVVELGAGTGPMTEALLAHRRQGPLLVLEPNGALASTLRQRFPDLDVEERFAQDLGELIAARGWSSVDRVVSSLPWAIWPEPLQDEVFGAILDVLAPDARMVTFSYVHAQVLPAAARLRAALDRRFASVTRTRVAWRNLPPAFVFVCAEPRTPAARAAAPHPG